MARKFLTQIIDESKAKMDWAGVIEEAVGVKDPKKIEWMSVMLESKRRMDAHEASIKGKHNIGESYGSLTPGQIGGEGATTFPSNPGSGVGAPTGAYYDPNYVTGSGDIPSSSLTTAMRVAARTPGLELLATIPMERSSEIFKFRDVVYGGGKVDDQENTPDYVSIGTDYTQNGTFNVDTLTKYKTYVYGGYNTTGPAPVAGIGVEFVFIKKGRYNGEIIVRPVKFVDITAVGVVTDRTVPTSFGDIITAGYSNYGIFEYSGTGQLDITAPNMKNIGETAQHARVSAIDDDITEALNRSGISNDPMTREEGEKGTEILITHKKFSKAVEAKTIKILTSTTQEDAYDEMRESGTDIYAELYKTAETDISLKISQDILENMYRLGVTSTAQLRVAQGLDLNLFIAPATTASKALTSFNYQEFKDMNGVDRSAEFGNIPNNETNSAAENSGTRKRKIASRILYAKNVISIVGRRGAGDFAVLNAQHVTALQDNAMFMASPIENTFSQSNGNMYYAGTLAGLDIYVNEKQPLNDDRILVGRRGDVNTPGLKFMPYDLVGSTTTIDGGSMSEKTVVWSRYALVPAGFTPETQYLTFMANSDFGWV